MSGGLIDTFETQILDVIRYSKGFWKKGAFIKGPTQIVKIKACVQPMTPNEVIKEIQGERSRAGVKVYTEDRLWVSDESKTIPSDRFEFDGSYWEVVSINNWSINTCLPHYESVALKVDDEGGGAQ